MLDRDLTIEGGLSEIGEIIQESHVTITPESPIVQVLKIARQRHDELFQAGKVYTDTGIFGGIRPKRWLLPENECWDLDRELPQLGSDVFDECAKTLWQSIDSNYERSWMASGPHFSDPFYEAIQNAIEHGTRFCEEGNVEVHCTTGTEGILAVISQPTPGLSMEKVKKAITCKEPGELTYEPRKEEIRGMGLACYHNSENAQVWFEFPNKVSPEFKVIILQTRKRLLETGLY
ncbi:hypothetical protein ACFLZH_02655 [Patescibacteria group bacterium]